MVGMGSSMRRRARPVVCAPHTPTHTAAHTRTHTRGRALDGGRTLRARRSRRLSSRCTVPRPADYHRTPTMAYSWSFGAWLKQRRTALDLTQAELAQRVGCATVTLQKWELDERRPSKELAALLAEQLAVPADERATFVQAARAERASERLPVAPPPGRRTALAPGAAPAPQSAAAAHTADRARATRRPRQSRCCAAPTCACSRCWVRAAPARRAWPGRLRPRCWTTTRRGSGWSTWHRSAIRCWSSRPSRRCSAWARPASGRCSTR